MKVWKFRNLTNTFDNWFETQLSSEIVVKCVSMTIGCRDNRNFKTEMSSQSVLQELRSYHLKLQLPLSYD